MRKFCSLFLLCSVLACTFTTVCSAIVMVADHGDWPADWPKELEPLRQSSRTLGMGMGAQANVYEIPFSDRETFEQVWPAILKMRTPGSPLTLSRLDPTRKEELFDHSQPIVRIHAPGSAFLRKDGQELHSGPPWPKEIIGENGELPLSVVAEKDKDGHLHWVAQDPKQMSFGARRARVDVELVVDGKIIDLNRIALPDGVTIIDRRFRQK